MSEDDPTERRPLMLDVWAWAAEAPGHLLGGETVELGSADAVLRLPKLAEAASRVTLRIALPDRALLTEARVVRRLPPNLVLVAFDSIEPPEQARLRSFVESATCGC
jgi:hypothetical protein